MPRKPRFIIPGQPQHVIIRGVNREPIFYHTCDYQYYLDRLGEALERHGCNLHAYVLMTNHVHLVMTPETESSLGRTVQVLGRYYVQYFNKVYERTGTLWEGRFKSALIDSERYLLTCYRYVELNPVRANMVAHPAEYPWSSYRCNAGGNCNPLITPHPLYEALGNEAETRICAYRDLFSIQLSKKQIDDVRNATNQEWVLGSDHFKALIEAKLSRRTSPLPRGGDHRSAQFRKRQAINRR